MRAEDEEAMSYLYSAADIFVIPSVQDNFPNTALEALACGVPTVAFGRGVSGIIKKCPRARELLSLQKLQPWSYWTKRWVELGRAGIG